MFFKRLCAVAGVIVGGFVVGSVLIFGSLDRRDDRERVLSWIGASVSGRGGSSPTSRPGVTTSRGGPHPFPRWSTARSSRCGRPRPRSATGTTWWASRSTARRRAYPLNMLSRPDRHVLNDTLSGRPIAVTWCGLCQSPLVFDRQADGRTLVFFVPGGLYGENMAIQDVETGSRWAQLLGAAVEGPHAGKSLDQLPAVWTDWKTWRTEHPGTTVLKLSYSIDYYRHDPSPASLERRYLSSLQWGLVRDGQALSWPFKELARQQVVNDELAGLPLLIVYDPKTSTLTAFERRVGDDVPTFRKVPDGLVDDRTSSVWNPVTGRAIRGPLVGRRLNPVSGVISHLRAWRTFHPASESRTSQPT